MYLQGGLVGAKGIKDGVGSISWKTSPEELAGLPGEHSRGAQ